MSKILYSYRNILKTFEILINSSINFTRKYDIDSAHYLLQQVFYYYKENTNLDFFENPSLFLEKMEEIEFQKELYFIINYIEVIKEINYSLIYIDLSKIKTSDWYLKIEEE